MDGLFKIVLLLAVVPAFSLLLKHFLPSIMGFAGMLMVGFKLKSSLPASYYTIFNNMTLDTGKEAVQFDHIVVSPYGIFVVETMSHWGWITGSEHEASWTRTFFRSRRRFQNPLLRNRARIKAMREILGLASSKFHSLVVFVGSVQFKTDVPVNVTSPGGMLPYIQVRTDKVMGYDEAGRVVEAIRARRLVPEHAGGPALLASLKSGYQSGNEAVRATLGMAAMSLLLLATGLILTSLVDSFGESTVARFPSSDEHSPFVQNAPPPEIDLPSVIEPGTDKMNGRQKAAEADMAVGTPKTVKKSQLVRQVQPEAETMDDRLVWESSLMCAYSTEKRHCACYEPNGRKATMEFEACKALADKSGRPADR